MIDHVYDIESLSNAFTLCLFRSDKTAIDVFYLVDNPEIVPQDLNEITQRIYERNFNFKGQVYYYDLHEKNSAEYLAKIFSCSDAMPINNPDAEDTFGKKFRITCDTDPDFDENKDAMLWGYNSFNYDTTMLAMFFDTTFTRLVYVNNDKSTRTEMMFEPPTARYMRDRNDELFLPKFKEQMPDRLLYERTKPDSPTWSNRRNYDSTSYKIRKNMLMTGRHLDVSRLNEKARKIALKRLLGMMGGQILESDKLKPNQNTIENKDQFCDLIAYNVSDVVQLKYILLDSGFYQAQIALKHGLLKTYPELIYEKKPNAYEPNQTPQTVRRDRLFIDSSSAQLATKALCPYNHLTDIPAVSFLYPSERKVKELREQGQTVERRNILEDLKAFFYEHYPQPELRKRFDVIYNYYKSIEGKNFNESKNYRQDYADRFEDWEDYQTILMQDVDPEDLPPKPFDPTPLDLKLMPTPEEGTVLHYFFADGTESSCFATFSTGGIHGAEYHQRLYKKDLKVYKESKYLLNQAKLQYPEPTDLKKAKHIEIDGVKYPAGNFLTSGSTMKSASYKDISKKKPVIFKKKPSGVVALNPRYAYTSADKANHEDFTSYYPNLLRMMSAFWNEGLGYDRYAEIFYQKQDYGVLMKPKNKHVMQKETDPELLARYRKLRKNIGITDLDSEISDYEREQYSILREGTKLILNSASGAADATFESNIRMNNQIISMRIIGQLFSARIGMAQTYHGAKITSTNTDGLYSVLPPDINNPILEHEAANINVEIEPEPLFLISKDTNNRIELTDEDEPSLLGASGGTLGCRKGPNTTKALSHPAIIDWALTEYLIKAGLQKDELALDKPFDETIGHQILESTFKTPSPDPKIFPNQQAVLRMYQNVIASSDGSQSYNYSTTDEDDTPTAMQHYNRVFIMKDGTPNTHHLQRAVVRVITDAVKKKRQKNNELEQQHDETALKILATQGITTKTIPLGKEAAVSKISNLDNAWYMRIDNRDLNNIPEDERQAIIDSLDIDKYLQLLKECYEENWMNAYVEPEFTINTSDPIPLDPDPQPSAVGRPPEGRPTASQRVNEVATPLTYFQRLQQRG